MLRLIFTGLLLALSEASLPPGRPSCWAPSYLLLFYMYSINRGSTGWKKAKRICSGLYYLYPSVAWPEQWGGSWVSSLYFPVFSWSAHPLRGKERSRSPWLSPTDRKYIWKIRLSQATDLSVRPAPNAYTNKKGKWHRLGLCLLAKENSLFGRALLFHEFSLRPNMRFPGQQRPHFSTIILMKFHDIFVSILLLINFIRIMIEK